MAPIEEQSYVSSQPIQLLTWINSAGILILIGWAMTLSYTAGQKAQQIDENTRMMQQIDRDGTMGTAARLDSIDNRLKRMEDILIEGRLKRP